LWIVIFAHLMWWAERHDNAGQFPYSYIDGIDDGVWWAAVTVTTVGYGDKAPRTPIGRIVGLVWMIFGLAMFSVLTGHMAQRFMELGEESMVRAVPELRDLRICAYPVTFTQPWLRGVRVTKFERNSVDECGELLRDGLVDAVLMDTPIIAYYRQATPWCIEHETHLSPPLEMPLVGLIFPEDRADIRTAVTAEIVDLLATADYKSLVASWFPAEPDDILAEYQAPVVIPAIALALAYIVMQAVLAARRAASKTVGRRRARAEPTITSATPGADVQIAQIEARAT